NNGGTSPTMALMPGSPAIGAGSNPANLANDQRGMGFLRSFNGATDIGAFQTQPFPTSVTVTSSNPSALVGQSVTFTATVTANDGVNGNATGTVVFFDGNAAIGTGTLNASGVATFSTSNLSGGTHSIVALYLGNSTFIASQSTALTQVVAVAPNQYFAVGA